MLQPGTGLLDPAHEALRCLDVGLEIASWRA